MEIDKNSKMSVRSALEVFTEISAWIIVPVILAVVVGKPLDVRYGTAPTILLITATIGFLISSYGIIRAVKKYSIKLKEEEKNSKIL